MAKPTVVRPDDERQMTVIEHLEELRRVLIISLIAWGVATMIGFIISGFVLEIILGPVKHVLGAGKPLFRSRGAPSCPHHLADCMGRGDDDRLHHFRLRAGDHSGPGQACARRRKTTVPISRSSVVSSSSR